MPVSKSMRRLLSIREAEEERSQTGMASALAELHRLEAAIMSTRGRARLARALVASSVKTGEVVDRIAGLEECAIADRLAKILADRIDAARKEVERKRQEFLAKRIERRQVETLCDAMKTQDAVEAKRKIQMALDEWHRARKSGEITKGSASHSNSDRPLTR